MNNNNINNKNFEEKKEENTIYKSNSINKKSSLVNILNTIFKRMKLVEMIIYRSKIIISIITTIIIISTITIIMIIAKKI
jgi:hypothetical protein